MRKISGDMIGISRKNILILLLLFGSVLHIEAQELSAYIINNMVIAGKKSPYQISGKKNFAIITIDSLTFGNVTQASTAALDFQKSNITEVQFKQEKGKWSYESAKPLSLSKESLEEFPDFISQFSKNKDYQINHTVFPFPINTSAGKGPGKRKLIMPRDWNHINFTYDHPQMYVFKSKEKGNNRKIYLYKENRLAEMFNFIRINKQWYLIEKYEFE